MDTAREVYNLVTRLACRQYVLNSQCQHSHSQGMDYQRCQLHHSCLEIASHQVLLQSCVAQSLRYAFTLWSMHISDQCVMALSIPW